LPEPTVVVCPVSVLGNWQRELATFAPGLRVMIHHGPDRDVDRLPDAVARYDVVLTTYSLVARDIDVLSGIEWGRLVLDEAQQVKNSGTAQAQAVRRLRAGRRVALTGTPVENRLSELWSIMQVVSPGLLGSSREFRERFAVPIERDADQAATQQLRRITGPFVLRRLKSDLGIADELPAKIERTDHCRLTREQATLYKAVVDDLLERVDESEGIDRRGAVLAGLTKLKQVCNHPALLLGDDSALPGRSGKLTRIEELLEEIVDSGDRALAFTQYATWGDLLTPYLSERLDIEALWLHGGVPRKRRDSMVEQFQSDAGPPLMLISLRAGGTGLNLTKASHVIHLDRWWNPAVEDQATDRAHRIGQARSVFVHRLVTTGTVEERIDEMITRKRDLAQRVVGSGESWLTELSTDDLREIVTLRADAVEA
jgi:SNF2 family DNA or RNA helicase